MVHGVGVDLVVRLDKNGVGIGVIVRLDATGGPDMREGKVGVVMRLNIIGNYIFV